MRIPAPPRARAGMAIVAAILTVVAVRLAHIALVDGGRLSEIAHRQHQGRERLDPFRGTIFDRTGDPLALTVDTDSIFVRPGDLPADVPVDAVVRSLDMDRARWIEKVSSTAPFVWVRRHVTPAQTERVHALDLPGLGTLPERRRFYPRGRLAAPVIGFAGIDSQGLEGIERAYDRYLRGAPGAIGVERDAFGRKIFSMGGPSGPGRGADVVLTIDSALQYAAERELERQVLETRALGGLALMLDPHTGEILALAQSPSFDPNDIRSASADQWRNRAVADVYEPGSTLKGLLAAAALEAGVASRHESIYCEKGRFRIGRNVIHDHDPYEFLTFEEVFQVSSNICSAKLGDRLGAERYGRFLSDFGLGAPTGVDLLGEQPGLVRPPASWKPIELATIAFGQGIAVTPLQLATAYAAIANGGLVMRPYVVRRVTGPGGEVLVENRPTVVRRVVRESTARIVREILERVVAPGGTGTRAAIPGVRVAGKTGTAQKVDPERGGYSRGRIASFIGFFPVDDPRVVLLVVVDEPKSSIWGGTVAAPVFRDIGLAAVERFGIDREAPFWTDEELLTPASLVAPAAPTADPGSYLGLSLREALARARGEGLVVEVSGSGYVVHQEPSPDARLAPGETLRLVLGAGEGPAS